MFSTSEIIDMAVKIEKNGEQIYLKAIDQVKDLGLKEMLRWMSGEEQHHAKWFSELKGTLSIVENNKTLKEMSDTLINDYLGEQTFSLKEVDFLAVNDTDELLRIFIEFEKDTILFYDILVAFVQDDHVKEKIQSIISEEEKHIEKLTVFLGSETELVS